jgi:hemoglobin
MDPDISEAQISALVETFYAKARQDPEIGPIFAAVVDDWPHHLAVLKDFWSSVLLATGRYKGDPVSRHLQIGIDRPHFDRWLALFAETAREVLSPESATQVIQKSRLIARNLEDMTADKKERGAGH